MKNNKGFTLIELILIVSVLLIVVIMFSTNLEGILGNQANKAYDRFVNNIKVATSAYISTNVELDNDVKYGRGFAKVSIYDLIENGFLDKKIIDPRTDNPINRNEIALIRLNCNGEMEYTFPITDEEANMYYIESTPLVVNSVPTNNYLEINTIGLRMMDETGKKINLNIATTLTNVGDIKFIRANYNGTNPGTYKITYNYLDNTLMCRQHIRDVVIY